MEDKFEIGDEVIINHRTSGYHAKTGVIVGKAFDRYYLNNSGDLLWSNNQLVLITRINAALRELQEIRDIIRKEIYN